jgi:hypothetical protein
MISEGESWLIDAGDTIIRRNAARGAGSVSRLDRPIYCVWVADYSMRNAGDLGIAYDLCRTFHEEGSQLSRDLGL